jgi:bacterioferritin
VSTEHHSAEREGPYPFLSQVAGLRSRARHHIEAISDASGAPAAHAAVVQLLHEALATELVCVQRYREHSGLSGSDMADTVRNEFQKYAQEEQGHADLIARRIEQLGGQPDLSSRTPSAARGGGEELTGDALADLLEEDLIAERICIESYREIVQFVGAIDVETQQLLKNILAVELTHAHELSAMRSELLRRDRLNGSTSTKLPRLELQCA